MSWIFVAIWVLAMAGVLYASLAILAAPETLFDKIRRIFR